MGLKKQNYESKALEIVIPQAYAIIKTIQVEGDSGVATFHIQTSRNAADKKTPIEKIDVPFEVNRNENPFITAYRAAKAEKTIERYTFDKEQGKPVKIPVTVRAAFFGWDDDIVSESES